MRKSLIVLMLAVCASVVVAQNKQVEGPQNLKSEVMPTTPMQYVDKGGKAAWDIDLSFSTEYSGFSNAETDGNKIYIAQWGSEYFYEHNMDGSNPNWFVIPGVSQIRDMAYSPNTGYFYGSDVSMTIYIMDMQNRTLVGTIPVTCAGITGVRHIAYDPNLDGGAGGFWIGNWEELGAVSMTGTELVPNASTPALADCTGSAYDPWSNPSNPKLWLYVTEYPSVTPKLVQFDINSLSFTGKTHATTDLPGYAAGAYSGGCASYAANGKHYLLVDLQPADPNQPNIVASYEMPNYPLPLSNWSIILSLGMIMIFMVVGFVIKK